MYTHSKWANKQTLKTDLRIIHNCPCLNIYVMERLEQDPSMPKFLLSISLGKMFAVGTCIVLCCAKLSQIFDPINVILLNSCYLTC